MKPYYQDEWVTQYCGDALRILPELPSDSVDLLATDPPYGISFMGKDWDRALPDKRIWAECFRVLKAGSFAFVMSIPRADCLSRMIISLEDAGFWVNFTPIFWAYASGFPKAQNIGKAMDKRLGAEREVVGRKQDPRYKYDFPESSRPYQGKTHHDWAPDESSKMANITTPATPQAKALDGSYGGFQPKPAVEVIIVAMKPLSEKTFVDQALKNRHGITWLDDGRIPYESEGDRELAKTHNAPAGTFAGGELGRGSDTSEYRLHQGRFPANLLVSDDVLNDGRITKATSDKKSYLGLEGTSTFADKQVDRVQRGDSGSFSRYFDLDKWWAKTFPFLIVPKASKSEKNRGLGDRQPEQVTDGRNIPPDYPSQRGQTQRHNPHPTVKPLKLMSYLITLGSHAGDMVLDPFMGSGTTPVACQLLNRHCIGIEMEEKYCEIAANRCRQMVMELKC